MPFSRRDFLKTTAAAFAAGALSRGFCGAAPANGKRPNILLFFPDQHRFDWLGTTPGVPVRTPHLDALAKNGARFTQAYCPSPLCAPSRAALASGKEYDNCKVPSNQANYPLHQTTFYTLLRESGYHVIGCGKFDLHKATANWGADGKHLLAEWGFSDGMDNAGKEDGVRAGRAGIPEPYFDFLKKRGLSDLYIKEMTQLDKPSATKATTLPDDAYADNWIARNGLELLKAAPAGKPWFLQVNFNSPHNPWDITQSMEASCRKQAGFPPVNGDDRLSPQQNLAVRQNYSAMVENIDRLLGVYEEELRRRGEWENTLVVYSSDHGEMLGDHGLWYKKVPWQPSACVPLIVAGPGVRPDIVNECPTETLDLTATFLEYAGVARPKEMDSVSLCPVLSGQKERVREHVVSGLENWRLVCDGRYKLVAHGHGGGAKKEKAKDAHAGKAFQLFDLKADPLESEDLAQKLPSEVERLKRLLPHAG